MMEFLKSVDWKSLAGPALFTILSAILCGMVIPNLGKLPEVTKKFFSWLSTQEGHIKNVYVAGLLQRLSLAVRDTVLQLENTTIEDIKAKAADGVITKTEMLQLLAGVKDQCIKLVKEKVALEGLGSLLLTAVFGTEASMTQWIADHIETQVSTLKPSGLQTALPGGTVAATNLKAEPKPAEPKKEEPAAPVVPPTAASPSV